MGLLNQHLFGGFPLGVLLHGPEEGGSSVRPMHPPSQEVRRIDLNAQQIVHASKKAANTSDYSNCVHCVSVTSDLRLDKSQVLNR